MKTNWLGLREQLAAAVKRAGRNPSEVVLLAVTKSVPAETALELARLGQVELGENRAQELERKALHFAAEAPELRVHWHFIGPIQRNKARRILAHADVLHSVDRLSLIGTLDLLSAELGRKLGLYLEVALSGEAEKHGFAPDELPGAMRRVDEAEGLRLLGLMTMAPRPVPGVDPSPAARSTFEKLVAIGRDLEKGTDGATFEGGRCTFSIGMSSDFEEAIAAGSNIVRIGSALYEGLDDGGSPSRA